MPRIPLAATSLALLLVALSGCQTEPPPPATHKVEGTVVRKDGQPYTGGGLVEFRLANAQHGSFGRISADGNFTLKTLAGTQQAEGAPEGEHAVTVTLDGDGKNPQTAQLKTRYTIKAGEVNRVVVKLEQ